MRTIETKGIELKQHLYLFYKEKEWQKTDNNIYRKMATKQFFEKMHRNVEIIRMKKEGKL